MPVDLDELERLEREARRIAGAVFVPVETFAALLRELRAAREVVERARVFTEHYGATVNGASCPADYGPGRCNCGADKVLGALASYDEAVKP